MFRTDRDALAQEVEQLRMERARLRAENDAMRTDLLNQRQFYPDRARGSVYKFGVSALTPGEQAALSQHRLTAFPVWGALLAHFATLGLFSFIYYSSLHDRLPQAERDDPSAAKAIGLTFVPYFNFYWVVFNALRLCDRINLQFRVRGQPDAIPRALVLAFAVLSVIPYVGWAVGYVILWPFLVVMYQRAANELAKEAGESTARVSAETTSYASGVRIETAPEVAPAFGPRVADLPGPDEAVTMGEAESGRVAERLR